MNNSDTYLLPILHSCGHEVLYPLAEGTKLSHEMQCEHCFMEWYMRSLNQDEDRTEG